MYISDRGFWVDNLDGEGRDYEGIKQHYFDERLCLEILSFLKEENCRSVLDLGCGSGQYVNHFRDQGMLCDGFDGNPHTSSMTGGVCKVLDLSEDIYLNRRYDWVLSLEVGEHIPSEFESVFIDNLHNNNSKGIILSWAVKGQAGAGHVNCQDNDYIRERLAKRGYISNAITEARLRKAASLEWFENTVMVFEKGVY